MKKEFSRNFARQKKEANDAYMEILSESKSCLFHFSFKEMQNLLFRVRLSIVKDTIVNVSQKGSLMIDSGCSHGYFILSLPRAIALMPLALIDLFRNHARSLDGVA